MSLPLPNYTQIPNVILDNMQALKGSEFRLIIAICRNTFGYHQSSRKLSIGFLVKATGLTRTSVINSAKTLVEMGWVSRYSTQARNGTTWKYSVNIEGVQKLDQSKNLTSAKIRPEGVQKLDQSLVQKLDPINKEVKERDKERSLTPSQEFDQYFWPDAIKKKGRQYALSSFVKARQHHELDVILDGWQTALPVWEKMKAEGRGAYIPNPSTWLNQSRWNDPVDEVDKAKDFSKDITPQQTFSGPWGEGKTDALDEFEAKLMGEAKGFDHPSPSSYAFKIIDSISKGGPTGKWKELMEANQPTLTHTNNRPTLTNEQLDQLRHVRDTRGVLTDEEMMLITPGLNLNNPDWSRVRFLAKEAA